MDKRSWICGVIVAFAALVLGLLVHGIALRADYLALAPLYRTQADANAQAATPSTVSRVITIPSVTSAGTHGDACGVVPMKRLGSRRSTIWSSESGLALWTTTVSRPLRRDVAVSSRTAIV